MTGIALHFGTAGLRAPVGVGPDKMNVSTVTLAGAAMARWLLQAGGPQRTQPVRVVVGYDARFGSQAFALAAVREFRAAGFAVALVDRPSPTPVLAWAVRHFEFDAGVQITASHNPRSDNGLKLYLAGGMQLLSPADKEIEELMGAVPSSDYAMDDQCEGGERTAAGSVEMLSFQEGYVDAVLAAASQCTRVQAPIDVPVAGHSAARREIRIAYTALHGVGAETLELLLRSAGFHDLHPVASQRWPDPEFPTVQFPNPEEAGACDALLDLAAACDADLLIALDPDADRCAIGIPTGAPAEPAFRMLSGDETGPLLADFLLPDTRQGAAAATPVVATTVVSSSRLARLAEARGWQHKETLTGFKHLARANDGALPQFAYEEAIGTCPFPHVVADKDGIATALLAAHLAAACKDDGTSIQQRLDDLDTELGICRTTQVSTRFATTSHAHQAFRDLVNQPPTTVAGVPVTATPLQPGLSLEEGIRLTGSITTTETAHVTTPQLHLRVVIRPSGTEPKLKSYIEVQASASNSPDIAKEVAALLQRAANDLRR